ncbi:ABC transporter substrate-binding protein [Microbacterium sp. NPDC055903]
MNATSARRATLRRRILIPAAIAAIVPLALAGCSGGGGDADAGGPVELTYWSWATDIESVVDVWNAENPDIQVTVDGNAEGDDLVTRIVTAAKAGNLPDVMQVEYQSLPVLVSNEIVADLSDDVADLQDAMPAAAWDQVTWGGASYAVPGDVGPLMMYVRTDRFDELGIDVPTTWDEFAAAAEAVAAASPESRITSFDATYPGWFAGLAQQAGAQWWADEDGSWAVDIDDAPTGEVADYWGGLLDADLLSTSPTYSAEWNSELATGDLLTWIAPVWGAGVLEGIAPDTAGSWRAVPLPTWQEGDTTTGYWGGSSSAISATSEHHDAAAKFLTWLYTSEEGTSQLVDVAGLYPAATVGQEYAATTSTPGILEGQEDFWQLAASAADDAQGFLWSPNVNYTFSTMKDAFATAIEEGTPISATLSGIDEASAADLAAQGYPVAE